MRGATWRSSSVLDQQSMLSAEHIGASEHPEGRVLTPGLPIRSAGLRYRLRRGYQASPCRRVVSA